jgi:serine/threonine-protein kinase
VLGASLVFLGAIVTVAFRWWVGVPNGNVANASPGSTSAAPTLPSSSMNEPKVEGPALSTARDVPLATAHPAPEMQVSAESASAVFATQPVASSAPTNTGQKAPVRKPRGISTPSSATNGAQRSTPGDAGKSKNNCSPPYVVDSKGIRRLRPECL